jgi:spermidine synthase
MGWPASARRGGLSREGPRADLPLYSRPRVPHNTGSPHQFQLFTENRMTPVEPVESMLPVDVDPHTAHLSRPRDDRVIRVFQRFVRLLLLFAVLLPFFIVACTRLMGGGMGGPVGFWLPIATLTVLGAIGAVGFGASMEPRLRPLLQSLGEAQARFVDELPGHRIPVAIAVSAGLSLFLELSVIRWHGTEWEVFAFYKNFSLLGCFLGLGLGYALARKPQVAAIAALPLLAFQVAYLVALRHGIPVQWLISVRATPILEQLNMGVNPAGGVPQYLATYGLLAVVLFFTALAFVPIGQLCGRLLDRLPQLRAYGWNLAGSLAGVVLMFVISYLWTPPLVWFGLASLALIWLQSYGRQALLVGLASSALLLGALAWPVVPGWERIYSPYQLLERGPGLAGLTLIQAAGTYYQRLHDLSLQAQKGFPERRITARYYEFPYRLRPGAGRVAVVGAGTGNDVAAALRSGAARVDAVEIDPAILYLGKLYHPERPYADPRVTAVVNDARSFLRSSSDSYDLIVYGLLDSHTLLSHTSSVRLDSYVYTVEALREARTRLAPGGVLSLSFAVLSPELGRKIYLMMQQAFDGHPPVSIDARYETAVIFAQSKEGNLRLNSALLAGTGFEERTSLFASPALRADVSTDDWPFFYMPQRVYPRSYLWAVGLVLALSLLLYSGFIGSGPRRDTLPFFFLGAGFMLVETKGIAELGLAFGNTWQVIGIVIGAILAMAWLANWIAGRRPVRRPWMPWLLLLLSLGLGLAFVHAGAIESTAVGRWTAVLLLTCPLFFSGIVFSTLLSRAAEASSALGMNLLGAMAGGVLEYNSMYFGFQSLYWLAGALYVAGLVLFLIGGGRPAPAISIASS